MGYKDIKDVDVAVVENARTGEVEGLEVTLIIPVEQAEQFFEFVRRLRTG